MQISVVIITKNEAHIIANTLQSIKSIANEIIIVDSGSTDNTLEICKNFGATIITTKWQGYGNTKNIGINAAKNNWILNLDADETIDETLKNSIAKLSLDNENIAYNINFKHFFCKKYIKYGEWAMDKHIRLFNKNKIKWNNADVHECLTISTEIKVEILKGYILHFTTNSIEEHIDKNINYAKLNAKKYFLQGKRVNFFKLYLSPYFNFSKNYFFKLGFLDGWEGFFIAKTTAWYTFLKYSFLKQMYKH